MLVSEHGNKEKRKILLKRRSGMRRITGMNKKLFISLCMNYNKEADARLYELWEESLKDYDPYVIEKAVSNIMKKDKFMPNLNRILEEIKITNVEYTKEMKLKRWKEQGIEPSVLKMTPKESTPELEEELKKAIESLYEIYAEENDVEIEGV
jgi:hypothetical protein